MSKQISMTLPDNVIAALVAKGKPLEIEGAGEFLKQFVMASAMGAEIPLRLAAAIENLQKTQTAGPAAETELFNSATDSGGAAT
jgi:hypothetical protein